MPSAARSDTTGPVAGGALGAPLTGGTNGAAIGGVAVGSPSPSGCPGATPESDELDVAGAAGAASARCARCTPAPAGAGRAPGTPAQGPDSTCLCPSMCAGNLDVSADRSRSHGPIRAIHQSVGLWLTR